VSSGWDRWPGEAAEAEEESEESLIVTPTATEEDESSGPAATDVEAEAKPEAEPEATDEPEQPSEDPPEVEPVAEAVPDEEEAAGEAAEQAEDETGDGEEALPQLRLAGHAPGDLDLPDDVPILEGSPVGGRRGVGVVASRFNGEITNRLLAHAFAELEQAGVAREAITVVPVPGAFELPLAAMALAKTRRYACIVALGCIIRGETAHFEYVAGEAASGLQLAALETGVPVAFGVLTVDTIEQAWERVDKGAEAVRTALEMADLFTQLRAAAQGAR
jgi:6,7-dimethyl-8-ribityllumazine synthase